ncbi:MAG: DUF4870 domain-containing protein [Calothrix sp. MO_192.B10]|nr:DUF4870 domain-containing protein [Calothrix sp. MO_192.B10]
MRGKSSRQMQIWAVLCHLSALLWIPLAGLIFVGIPLYLPFLNILGPLIIWLWKKTKFPWVDLQGRESLNFQLSLVIYSLVVIFFSLLLVVITCGINLIINKSTHHVGDVFRGLSTILLWLLIFIAIVQLILVNFAAFKAYKGQHYRYPFTMRFLQ